MACKACVMVMVVSTTEEKRVRNTAKGKWERALLHWEKNATSVWNHGERESRV